MKDHPYSLQYSIIKSLQLGQKYNSECFTVIPRYYRLQ